jgi:hypothetical protein
MRVKYLIDQLKKYNPDDELIVAYWDHNDVAANLNRDINNNQWLSIVDAATKTIDNLDWWGDIHWVSIETLDAETTNDNA